MVPNTLASCAKGYKKTFRKAVSSSLGFHVQPWTIGSCEHNLSFQETYILSHSSPEAGSRFGSTQVSTTVACACLLYVYRMSIDMNLLYPYKHILPMDMSHELSTCIYIYIHIPYTFLYLYLYIYMYIHTTLTTLMPGSNPGNLSFQALIASTPADHLLTSVPGAQFFLVDQLLMTFKLLSELLVAPPTGHH